MKIKINIFFTMLFLLPAAVSAQIQEENEEMLLPRWGIKTNLLYDATATFNLGVELRISGRTSLDLSGNWNPWTFSGNRKWKHYLLQPEFRWWTRETFRGHFFGLHGHYALYNISNLPHGPFSEYMRDHRIEGWLAGAGISYGYRWNFNYRWALEATVGAGYAYLSYDKFDCGRCGERLDSDTKHYFGPTKAGLTLIYGIGGKKAPKPQPEPVYILPAPEITPEPVTPYDPKLVADFIIPEAETVKARSVSGAAYLDFAVGRSEIVPGFRNNAAELQKIHVTIESVRNNPDATVTDITITGYASPEGTYDINMTISEHRAQALQEHIRSVHGLPYKLFTARGVGEDWDGLDTLVNNSDITEKYRILEIIRGLDIFDGREGKLMQLAGGAPYRQMKAELFPKLRRVEYRLHYTVVPITVEKGKEVMRTRPGTLSLNEMFLIANTYEPGSDSFNEVFETVARVYPDSDTANINAAASALGRRDTVSAARYLDKIKEKNTVYWNNSGVLAWIQGNKQKAAEYFAKAGEQGMDNAAELNRYLQSMDR